MTATRDYACNMAGTAMLAYDRWDVVAHDDHLAARKSAYAAIVKHITGRHPSWFKSRSALLDFLGRHYHGERIAP